MNLCPRPECPIRTAELAPELIAEETMRALSGQDASDMIPATQRIEPTAPCYECIRSVMWGGRPHPTWAGYRDAAAADRRRWRTAS